MLVIFDIVLFLFGVVSDDWVYRFLYLDGCNMEYDVWSEKERLVNDWLIFCVVLFWFYYINLISGKYVKRMSCKIVKYFVWN